MKMLSVISRSCFHLFFLCLIFWGENSFAQIFIKNDHADEFYEEAVTLKNKKQTSEAIALLRKALGRRKDFPDATALLTQLLVNTNQFSAARPHAYQMLLDDPKNKDGYFFATTIELKTNQHNAAVKVIDRALERFPNDKTFWTRKISVLSDMRNFHAANQTAQKALNLFPYDKQIRAVALTHYRTAGDFYRKQGNLRYAEENYNKALYLDPKNNEVNDALLSVYGREDDNASALSRVNMALATNVRSSALLYKKLTILQNMRRYSEALEVLNTIQRYDPADAKAKALEPDLRLEAARFYSSADPYMVYESILDKDPGNREALDKVIGLSMVRGSYNEALNWIATGLKRNPNDVPLLTRRMDIYKMQRDYAKAAETVGRLLKLRPTGELKARYSELHTVLGREYLGDQLYDLARAEFVQALRVTPKYRFALDAAISSYLLQKDNAGALLAINRALVYYPNDDALLLKKSEALAATGRSTESARIATQLISRDPKNSKLVSGLAEQRLLAGRDFMEAEDYDQAEKQFSDVLRYDTENRSALNYLINLYSATGRPEQALATADKALLYYPNDRDLLLKKASVLSEKKAFRESAAIARSLMDKYPYSAKYRALYFDALLASARDHQRKNETDSAVLTYKNILLMKPQDSVSIAALSSLQIEQKKYDDALRTIGSGLGYFPGNAVLLKKKAFIYEQQKDYVQATAAADSLEKMQPGFVNRDYADLLRSKTLKNQFGLYFLRSTYELGRSDSSQTFNIATVEYRRFFKSGSIAGRINYAGRAQGTGLQGEAELYLTHTQKLYSFATAGFSNGLVFPNLRLNYSLFKTFGRDVEAEAGVRYLKTSVSSTFSGVVSLAKTLDDFWVNVRVYGISDSSKFYPTYNLTTRYHLNPQQDFVSLYAGLGTSPDDRSRVVQNPQLIGLLSRNIGAGYQKNIRYRNTLAINGTWYNQKIGDERFQNQYDLYFTFLRRF
ncbi:MAG: tetratricopeptide repeat protein [Mucilaginibacter polytrichastri]|nr:tetratricopeptide repeat protein [Mucilaginibacter polytrichastri]